MKRFTSLVRKRSGQVEAAIDPNAAPEENVLRGIRLFCESGSENTNEGENQSFLHLPGIVEAAESSPAAAKAASIQIRKLIKANYMKPYVQYNAIMLIRILADNPGPSFTKNVDDKFIQTIKTLLQQGRHPSVRQILMETLHALETEKAYDKNLVPLTAMWLKERGYMMMARPPPGVAGGAYPGPAAAAIAPPPKLKSLPAPAELAGRIEEGKMSAQLLTQLTQSTPAAQVLNNELMAEFAQRCQSAQRSLQGYMACTNPAPDEQTFQTLIEVSELLNVAMSKHQRAILAARRESTQSPPVTTLPPSNRGATISPPLASHPAWQPPQSQISPPLTSQQTNSTVAQPRAATNPFLPSSQSSNNNNKSNNTNATATATTTNITTNASSNALYNKSATLFPAPGPRQSTKPQPSTSDPFSDDNQIPSRTVSSQNIPVPVTTSTTKPAEQNTSELPTSATPPMGATLLGPPPILSMPLESLDLEDDIEPPPGPPPPKPNSVPTNHLTPPTASPSPPPIGETLSSARFSGGSISQPITQDSDDDDLYGTNAVSPPTSPARKPAPITTPPPVVQHTPSMSNPTMSGASTISNPPAPLPTSQSKSRFHSSAPPPPPPPKDDAPTESSFSGGRIIDDEPLTSMAFPDWNKRP